MYEPGSRPATLGVASVLALLAVAACSDDDPAGPPSGELPITWAFESGLGGWDYSEQCNGNPDCYPVGMVTENDGMVVLEGAGDPEFPNSSISLNVMLPAGSATIDVRAVSACTGTGAADTDMQIRVHSGGTSTVVQNWTEVGESWETVSASIAAFAGEQVSIYIEQNDNGEQEEFATELEALCIDEVTISDAT